MTPVVSDRDIQRGDSAPPLGWQLLDSLGQPRDLTPEDTFTLTLSWISGSLTRTTADGLVTDLDLAAILWPYSTSDSSLLPLGKLTSYRLRRARGDLVVTEVVGMITGRDFTAGSNGVGDPTLFVPRRQIAGDLDFSLPTQNQFIGVL